MSELKPLHIASANVEKLSRHEILHWVNVKVSSNYTKVEQLCTGIAYCQLMELIFPNSVGMKKVKMNAKLEHEYIHNLKLFQSAFTKQKFDKSVPIERMVQGRFQDNFEFLQWFKKFYDAHVTDKENNCCITGEKITPKQLIPTISLTSSNINKKPFVSSLNHKLSGKIEAEKKPLRKSLGSISNHTSPTSIKVLTNEIKVLKKKIQAVENNVYLDKLKRIEQICKSDNSNHPLCQRVLEVLYNSDTIVDDELKIYDE